MPFVVPIGFNFADGVTELPAQPLGSSGNAIVGTPLPTADFFIFGNFGGGKYEESPGSPKLERAEQCTCEHSLKMLYSDAINYWVQMPRGTIVSDTGGNIWRLLSCDITRDEGTMGTLHYVMESISFDSPPDDFSLNDVSLDLNIIKHPRYSWALSPYVSDNSTYTTVGDTNVYYSEIKEAIIRLIQSYTDSPFYPNASQINGLIQNNILSQLNPTDADSTKGFVQVHVTNQNFDPSKTADDPVVWDGTNAHLPSANCQYFVLGVPYDLSADSDPISIAVSAAKELISKLWRQEDTPYIAGYEIVWTQYFFQPVYLNPGGYIEDPRDWVPDYFMNPNSNSSVLPRGNQNSVGPIGPPSNDNSDTVSAGGSGGESIFDYLTTINPQCYSVDGKKGGQLAFSSLRKSDKYDYERTWFKIPHSWLISPIGKWDSDIYTSGDRPQVASDYNKLPNSFGQ